MKRIKLAKRIACVMDIIPFMMMYFLLKDVFEDYSWFLWAFPLFYFQALVIQFHFYILEQIGKNNSNSSSSTD